MCTQNVLQLLEQLQLLRYLTTPVADAGFLEGGFRYTIAREARAKNLEATPTLINPRPFSIVFERNYLPYQSNRSVLDRIFC